MARLPDIDIDVKDRAAAIKDHPCVPSSLLQDGDLRKHPTGLMYQAVPVDPVSGASAFPSGGKEMGDVAGTIGYQKIDVIPNHAYSVFHDLSSLDEAKSTEFRWEWLEDRSLVEKLHHIGGHFDLISAYRPQDIGELAALLAVIRPGKRHLIGLPMDELLSQIWEKDPDGAYSFKKSHAFAYALMVTVQATGLLNQRSKGTPE